MQGKEERKSSRKYEMESYCLVVILCDLRASVCARECVCAMYGVNEQREINKYIGMYRVCICCQGMTWSASLMFLFSICFRIHSFEQISLPVLVLLPFGCTARCNGNKTIHCAQRLHSIVRRTLLLCVFSLFFSLAFSSSSF